MQGQLGTQANKTLIRGLKIFNNILLLDEKEVGLLHSVRLGKGVSAARGGERDRRSSLNSAMLMLSDFPSRFGCE